jgi:glycosyltransferase involved in cell wall biosynthesis
MARPAGVTTILFIHQNFPAQFVHLAAALAERPSTQIVAVRATERKLHPKIRGLQYDPLGSLPDRTPPPCHPWVDDNQSKALRAEAVLRLLLQERAAGLEPALIIGHTGWGELLAIRQLFPRTPILGYQEFFYHLHGADMNYDPEFTSPDPGEPGRCAFKNATQLLDLSTIDWGLTPTWWQWSLFPPSMRSRISVIHDGIDGERIQPGQEASLRIQRAGLTLKSGDEVVTYVSRNLEPCRGFHSFMRMLPDLQRLRPAAQVVIIGGNQISYGQPAPKQFQTWKRYMLHEMGALLDPSRIHFIGHVPHETLHDVLRISACHVYLTVPFVLSWSLLEAMACGALVVASATPPVQEVIRDGLNGRLVPFADPLALARTVAEVLADPQRHQPLRLAARRTVLEHYDLRRVCLPRQLALVDRLLERRRPRPQQPPEQVKPLLFRPPAPRLR